jgi:hypothetical protein
MLQNERKLMEFIEQFRLGFENIQRRKTDLDKETCGGARTNIFRAT